MWTPNGNTPASNKRKTSEEDLQCIKDIVQKGKLPEELDGLSPNDVLILLTEPFSSLSPLKINTLPTDDDYTKIPLLQQVKYLLQLVINQPLKLTAVGNLPTKVVKEVYERGVRDHYIEKGLFKLYKETDSNTVVLAKHLCQMAGLCKTVKGTMSATETGKKLIGNNHELFRAVLAAGCEKFNWGFFDLYPAHIGQVGLGYTFLLLKKYGEVQRPGTFYALKYLELLPFLHRYAFSTVFLSDNETCARGYSVRTFERFMNLLGLVEVVGTNLTDVKPVSKTALFDQLFEVKSESRM